LKKENKVWKAFRYAFPNTIPIMTGFFFLGLAYGISMSVKGFSFLYPMFMASLIFGGSLEYVAVTMLLSPFAPVQTFIMAFLIQARHLFYGISMLDKYGKGTGWKKFFLIFGMCDESFSINLTSEIPEDVDKGWCMLWVTWLNQFYWIFSATLGGIIGSHLPFNTEGIEFVMTSMFVVIFLGQLEKEKKPFTGIIGLVGATACLLIFGSDNFMIPTMICILVCLTVFRKPLEKEAGYQ